MRPFIRDSLKSKIPWFIKIPAKITLSRLPVGNAHWQRLNLFRAGGMDSPAYALGVFKKHVEATGFATLRGRNVVELGPGNSLLTGLYARSFGAARTWLIDADRLASEDVSVFAQAEKLLSDLNLPAPGIANAPSLSIALEQLNATYLTEGLASLQTIPDREIDLLFSQAVLEHVRLADFATLASEMRRVLKPDGVASHQIDFRDHLQNGLNNLRFSERVWESEVIARSGFYTNRLTWPQMNKMFRDVGFSTSALSIQVWPSGLPLKQHKMASPFKDMSPDAFKVMGAHLVLRPQ